jgi:hypothetical protein
MEKSSEKSLKLNGHEDPMVELGPTQVAPVAQAAPPIDAVAAQTAALKAVDEFVGGVISVVVNGLVNSSGAIPGEIILRSVCRNLGGMLGQMYRGEEVAVLRFRKECKDEFVRTMKSIPVTDVPKPAPIEGASLSAMSVGRQNPQ